jgi:hypothetical protein
MEKQMTTQQQFSSIKTFEELIEIGEKLVKSGMCPFKKPEDVMLVLQAAQDIGVPYTTAIGNFYPINGRVTAGVHIHEALAQSNPDAVYHVEEYYVEVFHYRARGGFNLQLTAKELQKGIMEGKYQIVDMDTEQSDYIEGALQLLAVNPPYMPEGVVDRRTTIRFKRLSKKVDEKMSYYLHEAYQAGLVADRPNTWGKYTAAMVYSRCFTRGSNIYFGDIIKGIAETTSVADAIGIDYETNDQGHVSTVDLGENYEVVDQDDSEE